MDSGSLAIFLNFSSLCSFHIFHFWDIDIACELSIYYTGDNTTPKYFIHLIHIDCNQKLLSCLFLSTISLSLSRLSDNLF